MAVLFTAVITWYGFKSASGKVFEEERGKSTSVISLNNVEENGSSPYIFEKSIEDAITDIELKELPPSCILEVPLVLQEPELPTGCESVALTVLLMYEGYELEKTTVADEYLPYSANGDFSEGYIGDPYTYEGAGCFPPSLVEAADLFLEEHHSAKRAVNLTGRSLEELFHYIADGIPVAVWGTQYMTDTWLYEEGFSEGGIEYRWYENEHCIVLSGYDLEKGILMVNDSLVGVIERDLRGFEELYDMTGQLAVAIL